MPSNLLCSKSSPCRGGNKCILLWFLHGVVPWCSLCLQILGKYWRIEVKALCIHVLREERCKTQAFLNLLWIWYLSFLPACALMQLRLPCLKSTLTSWDGQIFLEKTLQYSPSLSCLLWLLPSVSIKFIHTKKMYKALKNHFSLSPFPHWFLKFHNFLLSFHYLGDAYIMPIGFINVLNSTLLSIFSCFNQNANGIPSIWEATVLPDCITSNGAV